MATTAFTRNVRRRVAARIAAVNKTSTAPAFLGLDAGGTQTRWALADASGALLRQGHNDGLSALQLHDDAGRAALAAVLREIASHTAPVQAMVVGVTGFDSSQTAQLIEQMVRAFGIEASAVQAMSDIELACRAAFAPGEGYVVYAGTGSIAAFIDERQQLQRAGGRGVLIDDAGGGHWIACQALRQVWRAEDETPGAWQGSLLAQQLFAQIGGNDWAHTRHWVYGASRGQIGTLALAVARAAALGDAAALALLRTAGTELARLALALIARHGPRPLALAGRVFELHPVIGQQLQELLPAKTVLRPQAAAAHIAAARLASQRIAS